MVEFEVDLDNVKKDLENLINQSLEKIEKLKQIKNKTYNSFVIPYIEIIQKYQEFITPIFHIDSVKNSPKTIKAQNEILPIINEFDSKLSFDKELYNIFKDIYNQDLTPEQKELIKQEINDFKLQGVNLDKKTQKKLQNINLELSQLSQEFSNNIIKSIKNFELITKGNELDDMPSSDKDIYKYKDGYKFTLQGPSYISYITYSSNRTLREEIYKAYTTKAPENSKIIDKILELRYQKAKIFNLNNYASLSLKKKDAKDTEEVIKFLYELANKSKQRAKEEFIELQEFANSLGFKDKLESYDIAYYSEKLKEKKFNIKEEIYKPYFEKNSVVDGLFKFLKKLFDIEFRKIKAKVWDEKVDVYDVYENDLKIARVYFDLETRENKSSGAWMNDWHSRYIKTDNSINLPVAFLVTNFPKSTKDTPSFLTHNDVVTLFHEMGHILHHILSKVNEAFISGVNGVKWDVVEFPSQFLEYFAYERDVLKLFAKHYQTKEILSDELINNLKEARNFQSALATIRQLEFAIFDFKLHLDLYCNKSLRKLLDDIRDEISVIKPPKYNIFENSFSHIFSGGYAAGYYSYKYAEVFSASGFYEFIKQGIFNKELAKKYKENILYKGSSYNMRELFYKFANKEPKVDDLLRIDGILKD